MKRIALIAVAACVVVGGTAVATGGENEHPRTLAEGAQLAESIDSEAREAVSTLAAARTSSDEIPAHFAEPLRRRAAFGANPELSRLAIAQASQSLYMVPGDGHVCFILTHTETGGWSLSCSTSQDLAAGRAGPSTNGFADGSVAVAGLVPDGIDEVRVDGATQDTLRVENNAYYAVFTAGEIPSTLSYDGPNGQVDWEIPNPHTVTGD